jgi:rod shape-determining protein MreC
MKQSKLEFKYLVLIVFAIVAVVLGFVHGSVNQNRKLTYFEQMIKDVVLYVNNIVSTPITFVSDYLEEESIKKDILNKYNNIKKELDKIELNSAKIKELETELSKLKDLLELNDSLTDYEYLNATVTNRNLGYWYNTITIDKGSKNGVLVDMAVITNDGLIGRVTQVSNLNSTVKLLTSDDINNQVSIKIKQEEDIYGLLTGYNKKNNTFIITGIDQNIDITLKSIVVTTGLGGIFPSGILVGEVYSVTNDHFGLSKIIEVKSFANFDDISYVTVLKRSK